MQVVLDLLSEPFNKFGFSDTGFASHYNGLSGAVLDLIPMIEQQI